MPCPASPHQARPGMPGALGHEAATGMLILKVMLYSRPAGWTNKDNRVWTGPHWTE